MAHSSERSLSAVAGVAADVAGLKALAARLPDEALRAVAEGALGAVQDVALSRPDDAQRKEALAGAGPRVREGAERLAVRIRELEHADA